MMPSPRTSKLPVRPAFFSRPASKFSGIERIVFTLGVTSSPVLPSPRVTPFTSKPFSYNNDMLSPSNLCSVVYSIFSRPVACLTRRSKLANSSNEKALSKLTIGVL